MKANLSPSESHVLASVRTHDTEAYDLFLRGEYEFHQAESSLAADAYDRADAFYRQALARDPNFAEAAAELAQSRLSRHWWPFAFGASGTRRGKVAHRPRSGAGSKFAGSALGAGIILFIGGIANTRTRWQSSTARWNCSPTTLWRDKIARGFTAGAVNGSAAWPILNGRRNSTHATHTIPEQYRIRLIKTLRLWKDAERAELR